MSSFFIRNGTSHAKTMSIANLSEQTASRGRDLALAERLSGSSPKLDKKNRLNKD